MATWVFSQSPWSSLARLRLHMDFLRTHTKLSWSTSLLRTRYSTLLMAEEPPSMIAMRCEPYPQDRPDLSIFEEPSEEYGLSALVEHRGTPTTSPEMLVQLVRLKKFEDAGRLLGELTAVGVEIESSFVYVNAAIDTYNITDIPQSERLSLFTRWWSLVPESSARAQDHLRLITHLLVSASHIPDLPIIIRFSLISAEKGYAEYIANKVIPIVVRYCHPTTSTAFLREFRAAHVRYFQRQGDASKADLQAVSWYRLALQTHGLSGRFKAGTASLLQLQSALKPVCSFQSVESSLYGFPGELENRSDEYGRELVGELVKTMSPRRFESPVSSTEIAQPLALDPIASEDFQVAYARLRTAFETNQLPRAPHLAQFIGECVESNRLMALSRLRSIACHPGPKYEKKASLWALAEMLHHFYRREYRGVLFSFMRHFHAVGLPHKAGQLYRSAPSDPADFPNFKPFTPLPHGKASRTPGLWASRKQHALVWKVIVESTQTSQELRELYNELLENIRLSRGRDTDLKRYRGTWAAFRRQRRNVDPRDKHYLQPIPPPVLFDAAHFAPFMRQFAILEGSDRSVEILTTLYEFRMLPSVECLTILCSSFAREGSISRLTALLDKMEEENRAFATYRMKGSKGAHYAAAPPTRETYTIIIRYLLRQEYLDEAQLVAQRLKTRLGYVPGSDPLTDEILRRLDETVQSKHHERLTGIVL